ncbi:hypothetical protein BDV3_007191 [Batrachochytrium dendrobatidis]|uniref:MSP domain-containing protein n=1 Tax=Batrachochytrium dendrobatidis (strain JEL423) TaxID=403673 RepID=A0A177WQ66_BATDL|nr:phosphatidylinositol-binding protein scs2 [Batrachochytrium dendrobatidis]OAJ42267.1 hypothetical protein BDEG_25738 [Batrachochytrium dendrobatidis JEL423]
MNSLESRFESSTLTNVNVSSTSTLQSNTMSGVDSNPNSTAASRMETNKYLLIEPDKELQFRRPFTNVIKQVLVITNSHPTAAMAFKVRTTTPKQYCVRPNSGRLLPGASSEVSVLLQAMRTDPPLNYRCRDKFLVLAIVINDDVMALEGDALQQSLLALWADADRAKAAVHSGSADVDTVAMVDNLIYERKLRCTFLPALDASVGTDASPPLPLPSKTAQSGLSSAPVSDFHDAHEQTPLRGTVKPTASVHSTTDQELVDAREKIRSLQSACEAYKIEIERLSQVRLRRAEASGSGLSNEPSAIRGQTSMKAKNDTLSLTFIIIAVLVAFLAGVYLF